MKYRLLAPGPTPVPDRVIAEMNKTLIHHRTDLFEEIFRDCQQKLAWLFDAKTSPLILSSSGTGAIEASLQSFFATSDTVICITGGKFGDNWLKMSKALGLNAIEIGPTWGEAVDLAAVADALREYPHARGVIVVASETSTGVRHPYEEIATLVHAKENCLLLVDGVTAVGVWDIAPEREHIDILVAGSQKGLMLPPGLSFVWASEKAWAQAARANIPKFYFDLTKEKKAQAKHQTAYTPAVSLIMGLKESLTMMQEEGRDEIFARHRRLAKATRAAMEAIGLELFAKRPSEAITSVLSPRELPDDAVYDGLMRLANFTIAGGQENLSGKIFRIGHMGYVDEIDLIGAFGALEIVLRRLGYEKFPAGASLAAASSILKDGF